TLTVGGDVNTQAVVKMVEKYFGPIPACPKVDKLSLPPVQLPETRYISGSDNIRFPLLQRTYPTIPFYTPDEPVLDILSTILSDGKSSVFYRNFIKSQVANNAMVYNNSSEQAGEFTISIRAFPTQKLSDIDALIDKSLAEFDVAGVTDDDLIKAKAKLEKGFVGGLESVAGKVSQLAAFQTYTGNPNQIQKRYNDYQKVTKEDVMRVYNKYVKGKNYVALSWYPKDKENKARADSYQVPPPDKPAAHETVTIKYQDPKDNFDRSIKPKAGDAPFVSVPDFYSNRFDNGLQVIAVKSDEIPMINIQLMMKGGHLLDAYDTSKAGLANITARMMNEATKKYTSEQFDDELDKLGSTISVSSGSEATIVYVSTLKKNLQKTLDLMYERLMNPNFIQENFDRIKKQALEGIANSYTQATMIAEKNYARMIYGVSSIKGIPNDGMQNTVSNITLDDVKNFYAKYYAPDLAELIVVGDMDVNTIPHSFQFLQNWPRKNIKLPEVTYLSNYEKNKIYFIDKDGAAQSEIRVGYLAMPYDATGDYYRCNLMNFVLGGSFNSRINYTLREEKGWTYGARSGFTGTHYTGPFTVSGGFRKDATDSTVTEIFNQINSYKTNVKPEDLDFTKNSLSQSEALKYETLGQKAGFIGRILDYDLPKDYTVQQYKILQTMTLTDVEQLAKNYLPTDKMYILVVGDKKTCYDKLTKLGHQVVELDKDGNVKM
ncbi:MAG: insulinase family protein, partial [Bacteroidia bacterium]